MGRIRNISDERAVSMPPRMQVGRSRQADLRLDGGQVSAEHAVLWWDGRSWWLRDLDSRNGTMVDGQLLGKGRDHGLDQGQLIVFGPPDDPWVVDDVGPPVAMAIAHPSGRVVLAADGVLSLPDELDPQAIVQADGETWWLERGDEGEAVHDRHLLPLGGEVWTLRLPEPGRRTDEVDDAPGLDDVSLAIAVAGNLETLTVDLTHRGARIGLEPRTYHEILLLLARQLLADRAAGRSPPEQGWVFPEVLVQTTGIPRPVLNVYVKRLRQQFVDCGIVGGHEAIQRRPQSWELRLAPMDVRVGAMGDPTT